MLVDIVEILIAVGTGERYLGDELGLFDDEDMAIDVEVVKVGGNVGFFPGKVYAIFLVIVPLVFALQILHRIAAQHPFLAVVVEGQEDAVFKVGGGVEFVTVIIEDGEGAFVVGVVLLLGVVPAVVPDETEVTFE